jgi:hypothetical protein
MNLPSFNSDGDLPPGVYKVTLAEALSRFGRGTQQRQIVASRLSRIYQLVVSTGHLARFIVFGSFVTAKTEPDDVDLVFIMEDSFEVNAVAEDVAVVFRHDEADAQLGASIFWTKRSGAFGGEQAMVEYWQLRREGGFRGILEIIPETA